MIDDPDDPWEPLTPKQMRAARRQRKELLRQWVREDLEHVAEKTKEATRWPDGRDPGERFCPLAQSRNWRTGRMSFQMAHALARNGLDALDAGDFEAAQEALRRASAFLVEACWARLTSRDIDALVTPIRPGGRRGEPLIARLIAAVDQQQAAGRAPKAARRAAISSDPQLKDEFGKKLDGTVKKAISRARKKRDN